MRVTVKFFALLKDRAGLAERAMELNAGADVAAALQAIGEQLPAIQDMLGRTAAAVNCEYVKANHVLQDGDELALIPPVSGG
jgi:molybdopterin converting factor subunit 1